MILAWLSILVMGLVLGLLGAGGGILTVPILVYLMGMPGQLAVVCSYAVVGVLCMFAAVPGLVRREVSFNAILWLGLPSIMVLSLCRSYLVPLIPPVLIDKGPVYLGRDTATMLLFSVVVAWSAWRMMQSAPQSDAKARSSPLRLLITGVLLGMLTALLGVGGGFIIIPALVLILGLDMNVAVNTSLCIISLNTIFGLGSSYASLHEIDSGLLVRVIAMATVGMAVGVVLRNRLPSMQLKRVFAWLLLVISISILARELSVMFH